MSLPRFEILDINETEAEAGFGCFGGCTNNNNEKEELKEDSEK